MVACVVGPWDGRMELIVGVTVVVPGRWSRRW